MKTTRAENIERFASLLSKKLNLQLVNDSNSSKVCFATSNQDLRDDFKQVFTFSDVVHYLIGWSNGQYTEFDQIDIKVVSLPTDTSSFWSLVKKGEKLSSPTD